MDKIDISLLSRSVRVTFIDGDVKYGSIWVEKPASGEEERRYSLHFHHSGRRLFYASEAEEIVLFPEYKIFEAMENYDKIRRLFGDDMYSLEMYMSYSANLEDAVDYLSKELAKVNHEYSAAEWAVIAMRGKR